MSNYLAFSADFDRKDSEKRESQLVATKLAGFVKDNWEGVRGIKAHIAVHSLHGKPKDVLVKVIDDIFPDLVVVGASSNTKGYCKQL